MNDAVFEPSDLPALSDPNPIVSALFESPVPLAIALLVLGVLVTLTLRGAGKGRAAIWSLIVSIAASAAVFASASMVTTDRERVMIASRTLVDGVGSGDAALMRGALHGDARVRAPFASVDGRESIVRLALDRAAPRVENHSIRGLDAEILGPRVARSQVRVRVEGAFGPSRSVWQIDWQRDDLDQSVWVATYITPLWIQGVGRTSN